MGDGPLEHVEETSPVEPKLDPALLHVAMERFRADQNLPAGVLAGLAAALAGAGVWAAVTAATGYQIGWMAVGVGFLVGYVVRLAGKGIDKVFGIVGAGLALLGCFLGNLLTVCYFISVENGVGFFDVLSKLDATIIAELMQITFNPMDLLFYGIAIYEGYNFAFRRLTEEEVTKAMQDLGARPPRT